MMSVFEKLTTSERTSWHGCGDGSRCAMRIIGEQMLFHMLLGARALLMNSLLVLP